MALPAGEVRDRYRDEFLAELYGMSRPEQTRHAMTVLVHTAALRTAVCHRALPTEEEGFPRASGILCRFGLSHAWTASRPGQARECSRCGKRDDG